MGEKTISYEKKLTKLNAPLIPEKCSDKADVKAAISKPHQRAKVRRTVKLPRLKLADLVTEVTEENAHREVCTGTVVGNEAW